jgi:hypothetical protein
MYATTVDSEVLQAISVSLLATKVNLSIGQFDIFFVICHILEGSFLASAIRVCERIIWLGILLPVTVVRLKVPSVLALRRRISGHRTKFTQMD